MYENFGINREEAIAVLKKYLPNMNMFKHSLASEKVMIAIAERLGRDREKFGLAGLLHDIDLELVNKEMKRHGLEAEKILKENNLIDPEIIHAIKSHNEVAGPERKSILDHALSAGETITGLIIATTLVYPDKKLAGVRAKSVRKRMKEKAFAASVNRENIRECEKIGIPLDEFIGISLKAMCGIDKELGL